MDREGIAKAGSEQLMASSQCCAHSIFGSAARSPNSLPVFVCTRPMCCSKEGHPRASTLFEVGSEGGGRALTIFSVRSRACNIAFAVMSTYMGWGKPNCAYTGIHTATSCLEINLSASYAFNSQLRADWRSFGCECGSGLCVASDP